MSECELCAEEKRKVGVCIDCDAVLSACFLQKHAKTFGDHRAVWICDECDKAHATVSCRECEQNLCEGCDTKVHNKGKRISHLRVRIRDVSMLILGNDENETFIRALENLRNFFNVTP